MQPAIQAASRIGQSLNYRAVVVLAVIPRTTTAEASSSALSIPALPPAANQLNAQPVEGATLTKTAGTARGTAPAPAEPTKSATYALLVVDALRETGEPIVFDQSGPGDLGLSEAASGTGAALVEKRVRDWAEVTVAERAQRVAMHMSAARTAITQGNITGAQDELNQVINADPNNVEAYILLGDALQRTNPAGAAAAYRRATDIRARDGALWAKMAITYTMGSEANWPKALEAAQRAIELGYDTATVRVAMATAQFGRASQFRKYDRVDQAEDAEIEARQHLDRALKMEPDNPSVARLMAGQLVSRGRYADAIQALDRLVLLYPNDVDIQTQYAKALSGYGRRYEDAFAAWARVWKLNNQQAVTLEYLEYRRLGEGFDRRIESIGRTAYQLSVGVMNGALLRETALLELTKLQEEMAATHLAIEIIQPPLERRAAANHTSRKTAAALLDQSLDNYQKYLETGQDTFRIRAYELYRQSINRLNSFRATQPQSPSQNPNYPETPEWTE